jgi:hypothetical protein
VHPKVLDLAESPHEYTRWAAIEGLSNIADFAIQELARKLVQHKDLERAREALALFVCNYQPEDLPDILRLLSPVPDADDSYFLLRNLLDIVRNSACAEAARALLPWVYQHSPCSCSRGPAVTLMQDRDCFLPEIAQECLHDSDEDIRSAAGAAVVASVAMA